MLTLPFCGLASGEVKLVELVSMPGTPSLLQGDEMRRSCACSDWRFAFCCVQQTPKANETEEGQKKRLKLGAPWQAVVGARSSQVGFRICAFLLFPLMKALPLDCWGRRGVGPTTAR